MYNEQYHNKGKCRDCQKPCDSRAIRCSSCAKITDGKSLKKNYCIDCNIEIDYRAVRCLVCFGKIHSKQIEGKNNPMWNGGSSFNPYILEFSEQLKEKIHSRDNYKCRLCDKTEEQEIKELSRKLSTHHIDYDKENCNEENLITLCLKCHIKTNADRDYWFAYFSEVMKGLYLCQK